MCPYYISSCEITFFEYFLNYWHIDIYFLDTQKKYCFVDAQKRDDSGRRNTYND